MKRLLFLAMFFVIMTSALFAQRSAVKLAARGAGDQESSTLEFNQDTLVLSRSVYAGTAGTVTVGETLPPGCVAGTVTLPLLAGGTANVKVRCSAAVANGTYPTVFNDNGADGSFGVTSPIFIDTFDRCTAGYLHRPQQPVSDQLQFEFGIGGRSCGKQALDYLRGIPGRPGFITSPNQLDVSNSNTPGVVDLTNPVVSQYYRAVAEVDADGNIRITDGNAYSGNNGRAAIKAHGVDYLTGMKQWRTFVQPTHRHAVGLNLIGSTGVELRVPGQAPRSPNIAKIGDFEITQAGYAAPDKAGKDNNFRGLTIFDNTLYVTKGSGGNGINAVTKLKRKASFQQEHPRSLPRFRSQSFPDFPPPLQAALTKRQPRPGIVSFGIWFANANTLYVCDEGERTRVTAADNGNVADASTLATAECKMASCKGRLADGVCDPEWTENRHPVQRTELSCFTESGNGWLPQYNLQSSP